MKKCKKCSEVKPINQFPKDPRYTGGYSTWCRQCKNHNDVLRRKSCPKTKISQIYDTQVSSAKRRNHPRPTYSKAWLVDWVLNQNNFQKLWSGWQKSGCNKMLAPSVDRIDDKLSYTEDNIRLVTFGENLRTFQKRVACAASSNNKLRSVSQYDKDGIFMASYPSISIAARINRLDLSSIAKAAKIENRHCGGFKWEFNN